MVRPFAVYVKLKNEYGTEESVLEYLQGDEDVDDLLYRMCAACNIFSGKTGVNTWVEEHHTVYDSVLKEEVKLLDK